MIDRQEVLRIADLAKLELSPDEIERYRRDLIAFLQSGAKLQEVDTSQIEDVPTAFGLQQTLRPDQVGASLQQEEVVAGGPQTKDGFFQVPRIVEG